MVISVNTLKNGFYTFRRKHMFSIAMCIMRMQALWLVRILHTHTVARVTNLTIFYWRSNVRIINEF